MLKIWLCLFLAVVTVGCGPRYADYFPYHDDGMKKPTVALLPITDHSQSACGWDLADELNQAIRYRIMDNGELYLWPKKEVAAVADSLGNVDYFGKDITCTKQFCPSEFLVVMELIEHNIVPYEKGLISPLYPCRAKSCTCALTMKVRIRVFDIRGECPSIVLQEIFQSNHMIPQEGNCVDYSKVCFGMPAYERTYLALAHQRMARDIAERLESTAYSWR